MVNDDYDDPTLSNDGDPESGHDGTAFEALYCAGCIIEQATELQGALMMRSDIPEELSDRLHYELTEIMARLTTMNAEVLTAGE